MDEGDNERWQPEQPKITYSEMDLPQELIQLHLRRDKHRLEMVRWSPGAFSHQSPVERVASFIEEHADKITEFGFTVLWFNGSEYDLTTGKKNETEKPVEKPSPPERTAEELIALLETELAKVSFNDPQVSLVFDTDTMSISMPENVPSDVESERIKVKVAHSSFGSTLIHSVRASGLDDGDTRGPDRYIYTQDPQKIAAAVIEKLKQNPAWAFTIRE